MFRAHSFLWHYLWVAPNVFLLVLSFLVWKRGLHKRFPAFFAFAALSAASELAVYFADVWPTVTPETFWRVVWISLLIEGPLKFALIGEIFTQVFDSYPALARLGRQLIRGLGVVLVLTGALAAAYTPKDGLFGIVSGAHILEQTIYLVESGLLLFIFLFAAYFSLRFSRPVLGIALGLAVSACVHLASWAIMANGELPNSSRSMLDFLNMATYHACILMWFYYLLVSQKVVAESAVPLPENNLAVWNRELERLLQQ
jgi:hypothetical protein